MTESFMTSEMLEVALSYMESLDCPRSVSVAILLRCGEWRQLAEMQVDPRHYADPESYLRASAASDFLRKVEHSALYSDVELEALTTAKWFACEDQCYRSNERLADLASDVAFCTRGVYLPEPDTLRSAGDESKQALVSFVLAMRKAFVRLLGWAPPSTWEGRFGPGATVSDVSRMATPFDKMSSDPTFTPDAMYHLVPWTGTAWAGSVVAVGKTPRSVPGNQFFTVPKSAITRRPCAKEPSLNGFYQLGLGAIMKRRLKKAGLDLIDGQDIHRAQAQAASKSGSFATIDLSSASDTVCTELVKLVATPSWWRVLSSLRSPKTEVGGAWIRLEKFSSMGNGFTFELETTLFACVVEALQEVVPAFGSWDDYRYWVFGDDIIVHTELAKVVVSALSYLGFSTNSRKTFVDGPFRESCGGDYFLGQAVRPHLLETLPHEPQDWVSLHNGLLRVYVQLDAMREVLSDPRVVRTLRLCVGQLPRECRVYGPTELADCVLHGPARLWRAKWRQGGIRYIRAILGGEKTRVFLDKEGGPGFAPETILAGALYGVSPDDQSIGGAGFVPDGNRFIVPRDGVTGYRLGWVPFS